MGVALDTGLLCEGNLKFGYLAPDGITFVGNFASKNTVKFEYNPGAPTIKQRLSKKIGEYARIKDQVFIPKPSEIILTFDTIDADGLGVLVRGVKSGLTVTGATVAPATFAVPVLDLYVPIQAGKRFMSAVTATNTGATTTYIEGTDYDVDYSMGLIIFYSTGAVTVGNIKVGYTYATYSGSTIPAETTTQLNLSLSFDGKNLSDGKRVQIEVPKYVCAPDAAVDFMSENFAIISLKGSPLQVGSNAPMTVSYITPPTGF